MGLSPSDPMTALIEPNYTLPGLPGTVTADDSVAAKQAALRAHVLGSLSTVVKQLTTELNASAVILQSGALTAGVKRVRCLVKLVHTQGGVATADNKGLLLMRRSSAPADVEQLAAIQAVPSSRGTYIETSVALAANDTIQLRVDTANLDVGTEVLAVLEVTDAPSVN